MGLRELKKAKTRKAISDIATQLFLDKGYANVTTAEIAQAAEVSVPTLFNYFPTKETLVFDEDVEQEEKLVKAVVSRKKNTSIIEALREHLLDDDILHPEKLRQFRAFKKLIDSTPELSVYSKQMWMRHEESLAKVIRAESKAKLGTLEAETIAHFILDAALRSLKAPEPKRAFNSMLKILKSGWDG